jgi:A/G-specific adenine glycosylase
MINRITNKELTAFKRTVWRYYAKNKRDFPWRNTTDPYRVLVSEIMLQQTQAPRVVEKYHQFLKTFPTLNGLAQADTRSLLSTWQGLGYNRRALQLKKLAQAIMADFAGQIPSDQASLLRLPGIGPATAAAIRAFAFNLPGVYLDTNVRRVYLHFFFPEQEQVSDRELVPLIEATFSRRRARDWGWALLDYGAMLGRSAKENPNRRSAHYTKQSAFKGSRRELRGKIVKLLLASGRGTAEEIAAAAPGTTPAELELVLAGLLKEGFIAKQGRFYIPAR